MATSAKLLGKVLQLTRKSVIQELGDEEVLQEVSFWGSLVLGNQSTHTDITIQATNIFD
jgi:hypothetical protein